VIIAFQRILFSRQRLAPWVLVCVSIFVGCGRPDGPTLWRVSGTVSYGGKPVPSGEVMFTPDGAKRNKGRQGLASILQGRFDTRGSRAPGIEGGPMVIQVSGQLDAEGTQHFLHTFNAELKHGADVELNIEVDPKTAPPRRTVDF